MKRFSILLYVVISLALTEGVEIGTLPNFMHGITGTLHVINTNELFIQGFSYDGLGPTVFIYYYPPGVTATRNGGGIYITDVTGANSDGRLPRSYSNEDITITLPTGTNACDIGTFTIWCRRFTVFFSTIQIPASTFVNNGADPCSLVGGDVVTVPTAPPIPEDTFDNCMFVSPSFKLSWTVRWSEEEIDFQLCGCRSATSANQYLGFGLSGNRNFTTMIGADATIVWVDNSDGSVNAVDYHLNERVQCRDGVGACPDTSISGGMCTNDVKNISGGAEDRQQCVLYTRAFSTSDATCDITIYPNNTEYIVWAIGGLGETAFIHTMRSSATTEPIVLGRAPLDQCTDTTLTCQSCDPFEAKKLTYLEDTTFNFQIGPSAGENGYTGITGRPGWGIAWYVNGTLIPELVLQRGRTYTFIAEGGNDTTIPARYHPLYITNLIGGGRLQNTPEQQAEFEETVFAGFDGLNLTGVGRLCERLESESATDIRTGCGSRQDYENALTTTCESGAPGIFKWTPDNLTPDVVYYQCATHLNLGWKITFSDGFSGASPVVGTVSITTLLILFVVTLKLQ